jgi:hypothetical protein
VESSPGLSGQALHFFSKLASTSNLGVARVLTLAYMASSARLGERGCRVSGLPPREFFLLGFPRVFFSAFHDFGLPFSFSLRVRESQRSEASRARTCESAQIASHPTRMQSTTHGINGMVEDATHALFGLSLFETTARVTQKPFLGTSGTTHPKGSNDAKPRVTRKRARALDYQHPFEMQRSTSMRLRTADHPTPWPHDDPTVCDRTSNSPRSVSGNENENQKTEWCSLPLLNTTRTEKDPQHIPVETNTEEDLESSVLMMLTPVW